MTFVRSLICLLILPSFIFPAHAFGQVARGEAQSEMLYQKVFNNAEKKMAAVMKKLPAGNVMLVEDEKAKAVNGELEAKARQLEKASNAEVAGFKKELLKVNEQELGAMRSELQGYLNAMSDAEIASLGSFMASSRLYADSAMDFQTSYTLVEKKKALQAALMRDLGFLRSVYNKKIGLASTADLKRDLENNAKVFNGIRRQKGDDTKLLKRSIMILAGIALVTWGISSAVYGGRLNRVKDARESKLNELKQSLENQYQIYKDELTKSELDYLAANGYIRTICGNYTQPDSILCNRYGYTQFQGTKYCSVYCYRNLATGKETLQEPAVCTSPFIPADCYDPAEYQVAFSKGDGDGYYDGHAQGSNDGDDDGEEDGKHDGETKGDSDGYSAGYNSGYSDGYNAGKSSRSLSHLFQSPEFRKGYKDGFEQYQILFLNF